MNVGASPSPKGPAFESAPDELRSALAEFEAGRAVLASADGRADALPGGTENRVWRVRAANADWVVRLAGTRDARLAVDRAREFAALRLAAAHGFAPRVLHADAHTGLLVQQYASGGAWTRDTARSARGIARLGARLRALHEIPVTPELAAVDPRRSIAAYFELDPPPGSPLARDALHAIAAAAADRADPLPRALCHHDLHHRNVIEAGEPVFVDWEYAGRGEPLLDLAAVAAYHDFDAARRAALIDAYGVALTTGARAAALRFDAACVLFDCLQALWYDAADAWHTLAPATRAALVARLERAQR